MLTLSDAHGRPVLCFFLLSLQRSVLEVTEAVQGSGRSPSAFGTVLCRFPTVNTQPNSAYVSVFQGADGRGM